MVSKKPTKKKLRADVRLVEQGLVDSRAKAQALILAGEVLLNDTRIDKPGSSVAADCVLTLKQQPRFVSRGGLKLEGALDRLEIQVQDSVCVDVGASTGGFTDCLLQRGASKVYAVDVGHGLLANKLVQDPRVVVMDRTNAKTLTAASFSEAIDWVVVDASFIGIGKLIDAIALVLPPGKQLLAMIKPQFEVGRAAAQKAKGVITDPELRSRAIEEATRSIAEAGFELLGGCDSELPGPKGNVEYFCYARRLGQTDRDVASATHANSR